MSLALHHSSMSEASGAGLEEEHTSVTTKDPSRQGSGLASHRLVVGSGPERHPAYRACRSRHGGGYVPVARVEELLAREAD